jgi:hypothetical protein
MSPALHPEEDTQRSPRLVACLAVNAGERYDTSGTNKDFGDGRQRVADGRTTDLLEGTWRVDKAAY